MHSPCDVRIDEQPPDGRGVRPHVALVLLLGLHRPHEEEQKEAVEEADQGEDDEGKRLATELVEDAAERRGDC